MIRLFLYLLVQSNNDLKHVASKNHEMPFAVLRVESGQYNSAETRLGIDPVWVNYIRYGNSSLPDELIRSLRTMFNKEYKPPVDTDNVLNQLSHVPILTVLNWVEASGWKLHSFSSLSDKYIHMKCRETYVFTSWYNTGVGNSCPFLTNPPFHEFSEIVNHESHLDSRC